MFTVSLTLVQYNGVLVVPAAPRITLANCVVQVTEVQARTSLPHTHSIAWRSSLPAEVVGVMEFLQRDEWATVLTPAQVIFALALVASHAKHHCSGSACDRLGEGHVHRHSLGG